MRLGKDFYQGRPDGFITKLTAEYAVIPIRERLIRLHDLGVSDDMRRANPNIGVLPAWFCLENPASQVYPWICRGCAEFIFSAVHAERTQLHWQENMVICGLCYKNKHSIRELRIKAAQKYARALSNNLCTLCCNDAVTTQSCGEEQEFSAAALCRSCVKYWQPYITIENLKINIDFEARIREGVDPIGACFICAKVKLLPKRIDKVRVCLACRTRYRERSKIKMSIQAAKIWHNGIKLPKGKCNLCSIYSKLKFVQNEVVCMQCTEDKYGGKYQDMDSEY